MLSCNWTIVLGSFIDSISNALKLDFFKIVHMMTFYHNTFIRITTGQYRCLNDLYSSNSPFNGYGWLGSTKFEIWDLELSRATQRYTKLHKTILKLCNFMSKQPQPPAQYNKKLFEKSKEE